MASANRIEIFPVQVSDQTLLVAAASTIMQQTGFETVIMPNDLDPSIAYDIQRRQYSSTLLLLQLNGMISRRALAITEVDLFIPILTFVFGEAQLNGPASIVSTFRLRPEYYGLPRNPALLSQRLGKEAVHELGHTFGLIHCPDPQCVMYSSTYVEEIDLKGEKFCPACRSKLNASRSGEPVLF